MKALSRLTLGVVASLGLAVLSGACGPDRVRAGDADVFAPDGGAFFDAAVADTAAVPYCGPAREPLATQSGAIIGGTTTWNPAVLPLNAAQALAVGGIYTRNQGSNELSCTGTLIAPRVVLTAAHCLVVSPSQTLGANRVQFGVGPDLATPRYVFDASAVHVHPSYSYWSSSARNDLAVVVLAEDATAVLGAEITPVPVNCAPLSSAGFVDELLQVVGYGATDRFGQVFGTKQLWAVETIVALSSFDFTVYGDGVEGVCYGDSGGPAMFLRDGVIKVLGVLSWGDPLCGYRDYYARTDRECDFISPYLPACGAVTALGACLGASAEYCANDAIVRDDCAARGELCQVGGDGRARCGAAPDPCGGETAAGRCAGDTAVFCASDAVVRDDCAGRGELCAVDGGGAARCAAPDPCGGETFTGRCDGDAAVWCDGGEVHTRPCGDCGQTCAFVTEVGGVDCL